MKNDLQKLLLGLLCFLGPFLTKGNAQQFSVLKDGKETWMSPNPVSVGGDLTKGGQIQLLYPADRIIAGGAIGKPQMLDSIAWDVASLPAIALKDYTIKVGMTNAATLNNFVTTGLTTVFTPKDFMPKNTNWAWVPFDVPFFWDGSSNIIIDICSRPSDTKGGGEIRILDMWGEVVEETGEDLNCWISNRGNEPTFCNTYRNGFPSPVLVNIQMAFSSLPACGGTPDHGIISLSSNKPLCVGQSTLLTITNLPKTNVILQWEQAVNGGQWVNASGNSNGATYRAVMEHNVQTVKYRVVMTCNTSGMASVSNEIEVKSAANPVYADLPYFQGFEEWVSRCDNLELPDFSWTAWPLTGNASWRREDQGDAAKWAEDVKPMYYYPFSSEGSHSARFRGSSGAVGGSLMLHIDCSDAGPKELRFDYMNKTEAANSNIEVFLSVDSGSTFSLIDKYTTMGVNAQWQSYVVPFASNSPKTIIKFTGNGISQAGDFDMGIDNLTILGPCEGQPHAGAVDSTSACKGEGVKLRLAGSTVNAGLEYEWQHSIDGIEWKTLSTEENPTTALSQDTWYRCILSCAASGLSDTTAPKLIKISPFYHCYCASSSRVASADINIGNVKLLTVPGGDTLLDNGNPLPATQNLDANKHYSDFTALVPANLFVDSAYKLDLTYFTSNGPWAMPTMGSAWVKAYIDYNRDGKFDEDEAIVFKNKSADIYNTSYEFTVPNTAQAGVTGLRIIVNDDYDSARVVACGPFDYGETEDYLVEIYKNYCSGSVSPGAIISSDSLSCPGFPFVLKNIDYEQQAGPFSRIWQLSPNQNNWEDITGTDDQDSITQMISATTWFRVKATCLNTGDVTYSEAMQVMLNPVCYCVSYADGGFAGLADSSDIGGFSFSGIHNPLSGGHLNNDLAVRSYTNYSHLGPIEFHSESSYEYVIDHILLRGKHADAKITMFIDYNANGVFDIPDERVFSDISGATTWHKTGEITIPSEVSLDVPVGLRLIINNNTDPNQPSDEGCGIYTSGETEDYVVIFREPAGVKAIGSAENLLQVYPNPTTGQVTLRYNGVENDMANITVQNVIGQVVIQKSTREIENGKTISLDLNNFAKGVYLIQMEIGGTTYAKRIVLQ